MGINLFPAKLRDWKEAEKAPGLASLRGYNALTFFTSRQTWWPWIERLYMDAHESTRSTTAEKQQFHFIQFEFKPCFPWRATTALPGLEEQRLLQEQVRVKMCLAPPGFSLGHFTITRWVICLLRHKYSMAKTLLRMWISSPEILPVRQCLMQTPEHDETASCFASASACV